MMDWLRGDELAITRQDATHFTDNGATEELAYAVATGLNQFSLLDIIDIADILEREPAEVADTYFALMDHLGTEGLLTAVSGLPRDDRWHSLARLALRDDIYSSVRTLTLDVLAVGEPDETGSRRSPNGSRPTPRGWTGPVARSKRSTLTRNAIWRHCRWPHARSAT